MASSDRSLLRQITPQRSLQGTDILPEFGVSGQNSPCKRAARYPDLPTYMWRCRKVPDEDGPKRDDMRSLSRMAPRPQIGRLGRSCPRSRRRAIYLLPPALSLRPCTNSALCFTAAIFESDDRRLVNLGSSGCKPCPGFG